MISFLTIGKPPPREQGKAFKRPIMIVLRRCPTHNVGNEGNVDNTDKKHDFVSHHDLVRVQESLPDFLGQVHALGGLCRGFLFRILFKDTLGFLSSRWLDGIGVDNILNVLLDVEIFHCLGDILRKGGSAGENSGHPAHEGRLRIGGRGGEGSDCVGGGREGGRGTDRDSRNRSSLGHGGY